MSNILTRRALVGGLAIGAGGLVSGCDALGNNATFRSILKSGEDANYVAHRALQSRNALAKEFQPHERSPIFRANGTRTPSGDAYARHMATGFADWQLVIDGMVARPQALSLAAMKSMSSRDRKSVV